MRQDAFEEWYRGYGWEFENISRPTARKVFFAGYDWGYEEGYVSGEADGYADGIGEDY